MRRLGVWRPAWPRAVRMRWLGGGLVLSLLASALQAAEPAPQEAAIEVHDNGGARLRLAAPARRIVSLSPHLTELAFAAGGGDRIVGVGRYSNYPAQAAKLPVVGDAFALNLEAITRLKPDLILVWRSGTPQRQRERLKALGLPVFESEIGSIEGIAATLRELGRAMNTAGTADTAAAVLMQRWQGLRARYAQRTPVRVFVQLWGQPLMTVNHAHLINAAITACGGVNAFADLPALTPTVGWEAAVHTDPQVIVSSTTGVAEVRREWARFAHVQAVREDRFVGIDADLLTRMTPRFADAAQQLCAALDQARTQTPAAASRQAQPKAASN